MNKARAYPTTIIALKAFKAQNRWSNPEVVDVCADEGQIINPATVKRVFSQGSEALNFDYTISLEPIVYAFNRRGAGIPEPDLSESIKGTSATELEQALEAMERVRQSELDRCNQQIENYKQQLQSERRQKYIYLGLCIVSLLYELTLFALRG